MHHCFSTENNVFFNFTTIYNVSTEQYNVMDKKAMILPYGIRYQYSRPLMAHVHQSHGDVRWAIEAQLTIPEREQNVCCPSNAI